VTGLIYLNQVLFTVYVLRMHGGDASFLARYLPADWFELAGGNPVLRSLAESFPAPSLLAPSVLRVQAFLELPFVLLAFATVLRWLDAGLYRRGVRSPLLPLAAVSYTAVFCAVEAAIAAGGVAALTALRLTAARLRSHSCAGPAVAFVGHALRRWLVFFFVPALAVRYGVTFGTPELAAATGLLVAATGGGHALRDTPAEGRGERRDRRLLVLLGQLGCAVLAGRGRGVRGLPMDHQLVLRGRFAAGDGGLPRHGDRGVRTHRRGAEPEERVVNSARGSVSCSTRLGNLCCSCVCIRLVMWENRSGFSRS
jgi:hypothetical protein